MTFPTLILAILAISVIGTVLILQQVKSLRRAGESDKARKALQEQLSQLETRVQTLERIATDRKQTLKDEIDTL